jgi:hypothetical protein
MRAFAAALPSPLAPGEAAVFAGLYLPQSHLGGLPLVMLFDRFQFLREAIQDVWDRPKDPGAVGALLRMLDYYRAMAGSRRAADNRSQSRRAARTAGGGVAREQTLDPERDRAAEVFEDDFQPIASALRTRRGAGCACRDTSRWRAFVPPGEPTDPAIFEDACERCGHSETVEATWDEIKRVRALSV